MSADPAELAALERAVARDPGDLIARHNLGVELRRHDRAADGLAQIDEALRRGLRAPETGLMRAHLLGDLGRFADAVAQYRATLAVAPGLIDGHETLARLLPQVGRGAEALDSYADALARTPETGMLWVSALRTAQELGAHDRLIEWAAAGTARFGRDALFDVATAHALSAQGDDGRADALLRDLLAVEPDNVGALLTHAHVLIRRGDPAAAEGPALAAARLAPDNQSGWALLTVIWRLLDNPREAWLADYERLVMPIDIPEPPARADLAAALGALHLTQEHPADQSLRGGTQTRGILFDKRVPAVRALADAIRAGVENRLAALPRDDAHPFLARNTGRVAFQGSWSVRLRGSGFHISHIHPAGWLSSAFYAALPPEVGGTDNAGALAFGAPDAALLTGLKPRRIVTPKAGQLVVFPSYFWHGTLPFESDSPRLTVAFDALPVDFAGAAR